MSIGPGDVIELAKFAVDLYSKGFKVAKAAPQSFRLLLNELFVVRSWLLIIRQHVGLGRRFEKDGPVVAAAIACQTALKSFEPLVEKYKKLSSSHRSLRQVQYPFDQGKIEACRQDLGRAKNDLHVALTLELNLGPSGIPPGPAAADTLATASSPVSRTESHATTTPSAAPATPTEQQRQLEPPYRSPSIPLVQRVQTLDSEYDTAPQSARTPPRSVPAQSSYAFPRSVPTPVAEPAHLLSDVTFPLRLSPSFAHVRNASVSSNREAFDADDARSFHSSDRSSISSQTGAGVGAGVGAAAALPPVKPPDPLLPRKRRQSSLASVAPLKLFNNKNDVDDEASEDERDAIDQLEVNHPHRKDIVDRLSKNKFFAELEPDFNKVSKSTLRSLLDETDLDAWLHRAVWWLLKSRTVTRILKHIDHGADSGRSGRPQRVSKFQAAADYFKSCWILKNKIFAPENIGRPVANATWQTLEDLASNIYDDLLTADQSLTFDIPQLDEAAKGRMDFSFAEVLKQMVEQTSKVPAAIDDLDPPTRWLSLSRGSAGTPREKVIFWTFVNASIGSREEGGTVTAGAPYMLILWSKLGRSEAWVSLINQCGTVNLCTSITNDDLQRHYEHTKSNLKFEFSFPSQDYTVARFLSSKDLDNFLEIPKAFFEKMKAREARPEEFSVFREGLQSFDHQDLSKTHQESSEGKGMLMAHSPCEVSIYGRIPNECWRAERRLVVSSALNVNNPWCHTFWLPLGNVGVHRSQRDVELTWSDCFHRHKTPTGSFDFRYSYVYRAEQPNHNMGMQFETEEAAEEFVACLLRPWTTPFDMENIQPLASYGREGAAATGGQAPVGNEIGVWSIRNLNETRSQNYMSLTATKKTARSGFVTHVYFVFRDVDFVMHEAAPQHSLTFRRLQAPHYLSDIVNLGRPWSDDDQPAYAGAELKDSEEVFHFSGPEDMAGFLEKVLHWRPMFSSACQAIQVGQGLMGKTSKSKDVVLSLWERPARKGSSGAELRLTARCIKETKNHEHLWTTVRVTDATECSESGSKKQIVFKKAQVCQGELLDMTSLEAGDGESDCTPHERQVVLTLTHDSARRDLKWCIDRSLRREPEPHAWTFSPTRFSEDTDASSAQKVHVFQTYVP